MKKILFWIMALIIVFPVLTWGQNNPGDYVKYIPRTLETGNKSAVNDTYGEIVRYQYNPIEDAWQVCANKSTLKYIPMENKWTYVYPGEVLRFNPEENDWDYQLIEKRLQYNVLTDKWFWGYTPVTAEQEYARGLRLTAPLLK